MTSYRKGCQGVNQGQFLGPWEIFPVAWKLIFSEMLWFFKSRIGLWEIRQLKKRVAAEKARLGGLVEMKAGEDSGKLDLTDPELDLTLGQLRLINEEIAYLRKQMQARRDIFVENRRHKYLQKREPLT